MVSDTPSRLSTVSFRSADTCAVTAQVDHDPLGAGQGEAVVYVPTGP